MVKKRDLEGQSTPEYRFCVDFRRLNQQTVADRFPMARLDVLVEQVAGAKFITTLDLSKGYWQIKMDPDSAALTAFCTPRGLFQFTKMPFGLSGAPATFQRLMNKLLLPHQSFASAYLDDVAIFSADFSDHLQHLRQVLETLRGAGLTLKAAKCQFAQGTVQYLGHVIGNGRMQPVQAKVEAIQRWPRPQTKKNLQSFLGLLGYYRKYLPHASSLAVPLTNLCRKNLPQRLAWTGECQRAFEALKRGLADAPVLRAPDFSQPFVVQTDASFGGLGAVLLQRNDQGDLLPVAYLSRKLLAREQRYSVGEKECLAIVWGLSKLRPYLLGNRFTLQTDHSPLTFLARARENQRIVRWSLSLQDFDFQIEYIKGSQNVLADALSRMWENQDVETAEG